MRAVPVVAPLVAPFAAPFKTLVKRPRILILDISLEGSRLQISKAYKSLADTRFFLGRVTGHR
jgi:hypothetical protein